MNFLLIIHGSEHGLGDTFLVIFLTKNSPLVLSLIAFFMFGSWVEIGILRYGL